MVPDEWTCYKIASVPEVPTPVVYASLNGLVLECTVHERRLIRSISEEKFNVLSLSSFFRLVRDSAVRWISYERMMVMCHGYGALVWVATAVIEEGSGFATLHCDA